MTGGLVVEKPAGPTSHDVVARVRRALGTRRIGHTGTLDPLATGVLVLLVGRATRLAQYLTAAEKAYVAGIRLGRATPTYDAEFVAEPHAGAGRRAADASVAPAPATEAALDAALDSFRGTFLQVPPRFSAKKIAGTPAYVLARRHEEVDLAPVEVTVRQLRLLSLVDGLALVWVVASSGFYVRSLAHDLGERLGCGAHLETLRRVRAGAFGENQAVPLAVIEAEGPRAAARLVPMATLVGHLPAVVVTERGAGRVRDGRPLQPADLDRPLHDAPVPGAIRILDQAGMLLAIGRPGAGGLLLPAVVLM
jgi:tRNA pseudouridine55 synthase